jgi:hypothetical protein
MPSISARLVLAVSTAFAATHGFAQVTRAESAAEAAPARHPPPRRHLLRRCRQVRH